MVRRVLLQLSLQEGWGPVGWASDWGKNIYAPRAFLGDAGDDEPRIFTVRTQFTAPDGSSVDKTWKVTVKYAATVDLGALNRYIQGTEADEDVPRSAIQVLEVVMRSGVSGELGSRRGGVQHDVVQCCVKGVPWFCCCMCARCVLDACLVWLSGACLLQKGSCIRHPCMLACTRLELLHCCRSAPVLPAAARDNVLVIGSSVFFHVPNDNSLHMQLQGGAEAWAGYRQAVKPCQFGLSFNIDLAATAFLTAGPLVTVSGGSVDDGLCVVVGGGMVPNF
jgi:hypothetical protein